MKIGTLALPVVFLLVSGCMADDLPMTSDRLTSDGAPNPSDDLHPTQSGGATVFPPGIYYGDPLEQGQHALRHTGDARIPTVRYHGVGFDISKTRFVSVDDDRRVTMIGPAGHATSIVAQDLFHPARPSLSPDGQRIAVQATVTSEPPGGPNTNFEIFIIDLRDGSSQRISDSPVNDESPEWVPGTDTIVWSSFSPETGIHLHEYWVQGGIENETRDDIGAIHLDVSDDGTHILEPGRMRIYNRTSGQLVADLHQEAVAGIEQGGYSLDSRFPGQANRGTFALDGAFSPDRQHIVFDGAVERDGEYGVLIAKINVDGTGFEIIRDLIPVNPEWSNNHNFSQLNPTVVE